MSFNLCYATFNIYLNMNKSTKPIKKHIVDYLEYLEIEKGLSNSTQKNYQMFLNKFIKYLISKDKGDIKPLIKFARL